MRRSASQSRIIVAAMALLLTLALAMTVVGSAAGLGGVRTAHLGAASSQPVAAQDLTLTWVPVWADGAWRAGELGITSTDRGFAVGDRVQVTVAGAEVDPGGCEVRTSVAEAPASGTLRLTGDRIEADCGSLPKLDAGATVAVAVVGRDGRSRVTNLGELTGSLRGYSAPLVAAASVAESTTEGSGANRKLSTVTVAVPEWTPAALTGSTVAIALPAAQSTRQVSLPISSDGSTAARVVAGTSGGSVITLDLTEQNWTVSAGGSGQPLTAAVAAPQLLASTAPSTDPGVLLAAGSVSAEPDPDPEPEPEPELPPYGGTMGNALDPVGTSPGISYSYPTPWTGAQTNVLTHCHRFTVTNTSAARVTDWTVQFDSTLAPMWGMNPTEPGVVSLDNIATRSYDRATGLWTVGGSSAWASQLNPGESRTVGYCAQRVPVPVPNPDLFDTTVRVVANGDWNVTFEVTVTSSSEFYVPWEVEVDFADLVCGRSLQGRNLQFTQVNATPVPGNATAYRIQGTPGNTLLVSEKHPRTFRFAQYSPGPGWQLPCSGRG